MKYYLIKPEVAGELGDNSEIIYENGRIKEVTFLEFVFLGWLGDEILKARPCYIITKKMMDDFILNEIKGMEYQKIQVSLSEEFLEIHKGNSVISEFVRIIPCNRIENFDNSMQEDIYIDKCNCLIVSERLLEIIKKYKISNCDIEEV